ncbi:MAG: MBL fold metallo-hydrolase [Dehalococcoidia bacterium]
MEILPGIHQIKLPLRQNPAGHINAYLLKSGQGWMMIDTGWNDAEALEILARQLEKSGIAFSDISQVIYTHIHPDHYGLAGVLKKRYGWKIITHSQGPAFIDCRYFNRDHFIREMVDWHIMHGGTRENAGAVEEMSINYIGHVEPVVPDSTVDHGDVISTGVFDLEVIWTPGHDHDHICLYEPSNRILFSGDHVLPDTIPHIGLSSDTPFNPQYHYLKSLKALRNLETEQVLPAHEHTFNDLQGRIEELLDYHDRMARETFEAISRQPKTAYQAASELSWVESPSAWHNLAPIVQAGLVTKTLTYLELFQLDKTAQKVDKNGLTVYNAT